MNSKRGHPKCLVVLALCRIKATRDAPRGAECRRCRQARQQHQEHASWAGGRPDGREKGVVSNIPVSREGGWIDGRMHTERRQVDESADPFAGFV